MSILKENYVLSNGINIPKLGLGTWQVSNDDVVSSVKLAIKNGYHHIDTAYAYGNEKGVGKAVRESGIDRDEIFITTKIPDFAKTYDEAKEIISKSLEYLGLGYINLLLIHSPKPWEELIAGTSKTYYGENIAVWKAIEEAYGDGKVKAIGVSNFEIADIKKFNGSLQNNSYG